MLFLLINYTNLYTQIIDLILSLLLFSYHIYWLEFVTRVVTDT